MSAASGISASPALTAAFADAVQSQTVRFIKVLIQNGVALGVNVVVVDIFQNH